MPSMKLTEFRQRFFPHRCSMVNLVFMTCFIGLPISVVVYIMSRVMKFSSISWNSSGCFQHPGIIGGVIGFSVGIVFLLIAAFSFTDKHLIGEKEAEYTFSVFGKWFSSCTSLMLLLTLSGWYMCASPQVVKEGMIFTHPNIIGKIYSYVNNGPMFHDSYDEEVVKKFQERVRLISKGIFPLNRDEQAPEAQVQLNDELLAGIAGMPFFIAFGFSMVGAVIWALMDTLDRLKHDKKEFLPRHYLSYLLRCVSAPFVAIVIAFFMASDWPINTAPALFFFVGFFPKSGIKLITEIGKKISSPDEKGTVKPQQGGNA